jgi:hypothetical protein
MKVLAICGAKGSGKDTVANLIANRYKDYYLVRKYALADPIKSILMRTFSMNNLAEYDQFKRSYITMPWGRELFGRDILRNMGMLIRAFNPDHFIEDVQYRMRCIDSQFKEGDFGSRFKDVLVIITDIRFKNDVKFCIDEKIPLIKVKRKTAQYDGHVSEQEIDDMFCKIILNNDMTEDDLRDTLYRQLERYLPLPTSDDTDKE